MALKQYQTMETKEIVLTTDSKLFRDHPHSLTEPSSTDSGCKICGKKITSRFKCYISDTDIFPSTQDQ